MNVNSESISVKCFQNVVFRRRRRRKKNQDLQSCSVKKKDKKACVFLQWWFYRLIKLQILVQVRQQIRAAIANLLSSLQDVTFRVFILTILHNHAVMCLKYCGWKYFSILVHRFVRQFRCWKLTEVLHVLFLSLSAYATFFHSEHSFNSSITHNSRLCLVLYLYGPSVTAGFPLLCNVVI